MLNKGERERKAIILLRSEKQFKIVCSSLLLTSKFYKNADLFYFPVDLQLYIPYILYILLSLRIVMFLDLDSTTSLICILYYIYMYITFVYTYCMCIYTHVLIIHTMCQQKVKLLKYGIQLVYLLRPKKYNKFQGIFSNVELRGQDSFLQLYHFN